MRAKACLVIAMTALALVFWPAPGALAQEKVMPHEQPLGEGDGLGLEGYSTFDNPAYHYAGIQLPPSGTYYRQAGLSPDGTVVVAQKSWNDGTYNRTEVVLMNADGSGETVVSPGDSGQGDIYGYMSPFWSDDGTAVGYTEVHNANPNKVIVHDIASNSDSYIYEPIAPADVSNPDFLGGSKTSIVFWAYGNVGGADLWTWDGTTLTNITDTDDYKEYEPVSNADGSVILYWSGETTAEPVNTTHTLTNVGGTWTKDVGFTPIADSYWSYWLDSSATGIAVTVMSTKDAYLYDGAGAFVADLTGPGYSGGSGQWNFFGSGVQGPDGELLLTSNAGRGGTAGRDVVVAADRVALYVDASGSDSNPGTSHAPFAAVQKGVAEVASGGTVHVAAGTYVEAGQIVVGKDVTIDGEGCATTMIRTDRDTGTSGDARSWWLVNTGAVLNLSDLTLDGSGHKVAQGVRYKGSGAIDRVCFTQIQYNASGPDYNGLAVAALGDGPVDVSDSFFDNIGRVGTIYFGSGVNGSVYDGNTYAGKGDGNWLDYGVELGGGAQATVSNSTISGNTGVASSDGSTSAGILVTTYYGAGTAAAVTGNILTANTDGIAVGYDSSDTSVVVVHGNSIYGNTSYGISTAGPAIDAQDNWWGSANGPAHLSNTFNVGSQGNAVENGIDFVPWLDAAPPGGLSFAPVTTDSPLDAYSSIQAGVDGVDDGYTVSAVAGTFSEAQIVIDTPMTVQGAGIDQSVIDGGGSSLSQVGLVRIVAGGDVTFDGFTVQNAGGVGGLAMVGSRARVEGSVDDGAVRVGIYASAGTATPIYTISDNKILGSNDPDNWNDFGFYGNNSDDTLYLTGNEIYNAGANSILLERHRGATHVNYNTFDVGCWGTDGYFNMNYGADDIAALQEVRGNVIDAGSGGPFDYDHRATAITFASSFTGAAGGFSNVAIAENEITNLQSYRRGIGTWNNSAAGTPGGISDIIIDGNVVTGTGPEVTGSRGIDFIGRVQTATVQNNEVSDTETGFLNITWNGHIALAADMAAFDANCFSGNGLAVDWTGDTLAAEDNYWDDASGPSHASNPNGTGDAVSDGVDFLPWLDACRGESTGPVYCDTSANWYLTIQAGVDDCDPGGTVTVSAGTFAENLVIDKALTLLCPNAGIDPNGATPRVPEANIVPATNGWNSWGTIVDLQASNVTIDGCTFDGDNPAISGGYSMGEADINANAAVDNAGYYVLDHLRVQNNIVRNLLYSSIYLDTPYGENHSSNYILHNLFDNMWEGIQIYAAETDVSHNVFTNVTRAVSYHQVNTAPDSGFVPRIADNVVNVVYNWDDTDRNVGIWVNGRQGTAAALGIEGNTVNTPTAMPAGKKYWGYALYAVTGDRVVTFSGNTLNGYGNCDVGLWAWYVDSTNPVVLGGGGGGGLYDIKTTGVLLSNYHGTWGPGPTALTLSGLPITVASGGTLVRAWEGTTEPSGGPMEPPRNRKSLLAPDHRAPEANDTTLTVTGGTYSNGAIGIDVDGATATASGATISNNDTGVYIRNGGTGTFTDNCITDNTSYGMNNTTGAAVAAVVNWWGDASGPYHATTNPTGAGDAVSDDVAFAPWISDGCHGTVTTGHWLNLRTGAYSGLASALATAISGDTIQATCPDATSIPGGGTATVGNVTIDLNGCTAGPGSPFLIVNADNVTVLGPGLLDGWDGSANSLDPGIKVLTGADNFILQGAEVKRWADGIELAGSVNSFKLGGNWIHSNTDAGLQVDTGVTLGGVVTIQGNLFKANGGNGIQNNGVTNPLRAEYNSWGHLLGPASGDGASAQVDYTPWTFIEPFLDMAPEAEATAVDVAESDSFDVKLKMDAAKVYGFSFQITYDTAWLTLDSVTFAAPWNGSGRCVSLGSTPGVLRYRCSLQFPDAEYDADGGTIASLNFTAAAGPAGENGPWPTTLDILHDPLLTKAGAIGGEKIFVDNAGYNDPSIPERDITDADDGWVNIVGLANFTGYVDLQGRLNDGLAWIEVHQSSTYGSTLLATGTTASSGGYTTSHTTGNRLLVGGTYWLLIDRDLYLPTSVLWPTPMPYEDSKPLDDRPLTALDMAFLLGGDATDNDHVDINDATCIGWDYGSTVSTCIGEDPLRNAHSDVNGDGLIDLYDLVLMGTNYTWSYSPWSP